MGHPAEQILSLGFVVSGDIQITRRLRAVEASQQGGTTVLATPLHEYAQCLQRRRADAVIDAQRNMTADHAIEIAFKISLAVFPDE